MFQWNIIYYSREEILARWLMPNDRYPAYPATVDAALSAHEPVALVGLLEDGYPSVSRLDGRELEIVDEKYFIIYYPDKKLLEDNNFYFQ